MSELRRRRKCGGPTSVRGMTLTAISVLLANGAAAQTPPLLEEIIVTAQKREQNVQDIPVAVTAYTNQMLQDSGIKDIFDLQQNSPTLVANQSQNSTRSSFQIRGIGTSSQVFALEPAVGVYVDGVYRARPSSIINNLVDMEAVEVLRGPQGTLFGKNTASGAINMRTVRPRHEPDAFVELTAGDYSLFNLSAAGNLSLVDDVLAFRATAFSSTRDGFADDVALGSETLNDRDRIGGRLQLYYTPNDRFDVRVIGDYSEINEICCAALTRFDSVFAIGRTGPGGTPIPGTDFVLQNFFGGTVIPGNRFEDYTSAYNELPQSSNNDWGLSVEINYDFENVTLTSISAYREFDTFDRIDADFADVDLITDINSAEQSSFSQELRLTGDIGERTTYVAGLYYFTQDMDIISRLNAGPPFSAYVQAVRPDLVALIDGINAISAATGGALPPAAEPFPFGSFGNDDETQGQDSVAIFAQADIDLSEQLILTLGLRYTDEDKDFRGIFTQNAQGPAPDFAAIQTNLVLAGMGLPFDPSAFTPVYFPGWGNYVFPPIAPRPDLDVDISDDQVTGTIKLSWFATDTTMFYASYGTGYKAGGINTDRIGVQFDPVFGPETADAVEVGLKADFPDQSLRLNLAAHNTQLDDLQATSFTGSGFNLQNAGKVDTYGAELELWWTPTDTFHLHGSYAYNVADFDDFFNGTCWVATPFHFGIPDPGFNTPGGVFDPGTSTCDRSGDRVPSNPEHYFFLSAGKDFRLGGATVGYVRGEYAYTGDTMTDGNNDPLKLRDSYDKVNLRLGVIFENIDAELTLWGRNITDEKSYETVFDVPIQDGKLNAYAHEPRTWGVTFRKNFF